MTDEQILAVLEDVMRKQGQEVKRLPPGWLNFARAILAASAPNPSDKQEAVVYAVSDEAAMQWVERHDLENIIRDPGTARCAIDDARSLHLIDAPLAQSSEMVYLPVTPVAFDQPAEQDRIDAERYRWLRKQNWNEADMAVVCRPKEAIKLGYDCPNGERLDDAIDEAVCGKSLSKK
jgi:hypothetical protein